MLSIHHLAINVGSRRRVYRIAPWARERDVEIESDPQEYASSPGYYAVFLHYRDGIKVEVMTRPRFRTALRAVRPRRRRSDPRIARPR